MVTGIRSPAEAGAPPLPASGQRRPEEPEASFSAILAALAGSVPVLPAVGADAAAGEAALPVGFFGDGEIPLPIHRAADGQVVGLDLELPHPELGMVRVRLDSRGGPTACLIVESRASQELVEGQLDHLRQRLAGLGPWIVKVSVADPGSGDRQPVVRRADRFRALGQDRRSVRRVDVVA
ncbi:MAG: flagellar hook-length control protein FliK [Gemmataceae bacterium]|nr:flagellar hook-length control protein FliK [Gemmataceae bacterium]